MPPNQQDHTPDPLHPPSGSTAPEQQNSQLGPGISGIKVIQPLDPNLKVDSAPAQPPAQPISTTPTNNSPQGEATNAATQPANATQPPQRVTNSSSIYPDAIYDPRTANYQSPGPENKKDTSESYTFDNGYSIGGTIFGLQLLAGIILGLILFGIDSSVLKTATFTIVVIVSLVYYLVEFFVVAYIPYNTIKSSDIDEPFWLTIFGIAIQSIIIGCLFELVISLLVFSVINHGVPSSLKHIDGAGLGAISIVIYIGFLIASYFLTKLSWGIAFSLFGKITSKVVIKVIGIVVIAVIVGGISFHYLTLYRSRVSTNQSNALTTSQSASLSNYKVNGNPSYSVNFYKDSTVTAIQRQTVLVHSGKNGEQAYIIVSTATGPTSSCAFDSMPTFTFSVQGTQGLGCYQSNGSTGYVQINGQNYVVKTISDNNDQTLQATKSIFNSIVIK